MVAVAGALALVLALALARTLTLASTAQGLTPSLPDAYKGWSVRILEPVHGTTLPSMSVPVKLAVTGPPGSDPEGAQVCLSLSGKLPPTCVVQRDLHLTSFEGVHSLQACVVFPDGTSCYDREYSPMQVGPHCPPERCPPEPAYALMLTACAGWEGGMERGWGGVWAGGRRPELITCG